MNQNLRSILFLGVLTLPLTACDGGSSGTGITTAQGNVGSAVAALHAVPRMPESRLARLMRWLRPETTALARTQVEDIRVSIEGTRIETRTDGAGAFALHGDFAGPIGMIFELPDSGERVRLVITVPRGGDLTLGNVRIDGGTGRVSVDLQSVRFGALVAGTNCPRAVVTLVSRATPRDGNAYTVDLGAASLRDAAGAPLDCTSLTPGRSVDVEGEVRDDGHVEARSVEAENDRQGESGSGGSGGSGGGETSGAASGGGSGTTSDGGSGKSGGDDGSSDKGSSDSGK